jgi:hypothetical protein
MTRMDFRRSRTRGHAMVNVKDNLEPLATDPAAQWLARHGGPPLPKGKGKSDWKQIRKRKKERRKREAARLRREGMLPKQLAVPSGTVAVGLDGPKCPRCNKPTQIREHQRIGPKQLRRRFYFRRWFFCMNMDCRTTLIMRDEFKVWN